MYMYNITFFSHAGMLLWFCQDAQLLQRICEGGRSIQKEVQANKESIPDDVVDADITILEKFFAKDAWTVVQHAGEELKNTTINFCATNESYSQNSGTEMQGVAMPSL